MLPLIGLMAGTAYLGQRYAMPAIREAQRKQQAGIMGGLLGNLPEGAGPDETARALAMGGMLSPEALMQYGFGDQGAERDFGYDWQLEMLRQRSQLEQLAQAGQARYMEGRQKIVDIFQPQLDAIHAQNQSITNLLGIAQEYNAMSPFERSAALGRPEGRAVRAQVAELEEQMFSDFKRRVYGEAEPPPQELDRLRNAFLTVTGGGTLSALDSGRFDTVMEVYQRRLEENERRARELAVTYDRNLQAFDLNELQGPPGMPGFAGGSVEVNPYGRETRSDRNLINTESGGDWGAQNDAVGSSGRVGHFGRAQFSQDRLDEVREGLNLNFSTQEFLRNPRLQKAAEAWHFNDIEDYIEDNGLDEYIGGRIGRIPITLQGLKNVAHLGGKRGLSRFLASGGKYDPADRNGTRLSDYLALGARS